MLLGFGKLPHQLWPKLKICPCFNLRRGLWGCDPANALVRVHSIHLWDVSVSVRTSLSHCEDWSLLEKCQNTILELKCTSRTQISKATLPDDLKHTHTHKSMPLIVKLECVTCVNAVFKTLLWHGFIMLNFPLITDIFFNAYVWETWGCDYSQLNV